MNSVQPKKQDGNEDDDDTDDDDDCRVCVGHSLMVKGLSSVWLGSMISTRSNLSSKLISWKVPLQNFFIINCNNQDGARLHDVGCHHKKAPICEQLS